jgi:uncharacterized protein YbaR (Trm112 family)
VFDLGGLGKCPCCKQTKVLTVHHSKETNDKIMMCQDCHRIIEEYFKVIEKIKRPTQ